MNVNVMRMNKMSYSYHNKEWYLEEINRSFIDYFNHWKSFLKHLDFKNKQYVASRADPALRARFISGNDVFWQRAPPIMLSIYEARHHCPGTNIKNYTDILEHDFYTVIKHDILLKLYETIPSYEFDRSISFMPNEFCESDINVVLNNILAHHGPRYPGSNGLVLFPFNNAYNPFERTWFDQISLFLKKEGFQCAVFNQNYDLSLANCVFVLNALTIYYDFDFYYDFAYNAFHVQLKFAIDPLECFRLKSLLTPKEKELALDMEYRLKKWDEAITIKKLPGGLNFIF